MYRVKVSVTYRLCRCLTTNRQAATQAVFVINDLKTHQLQFVQSVQSTLLIQVGGASLIKPGNPASYGVTRGPQCYSYYRLELGVLGHATTHNP